jgi:undecaprenyl-diphosphatase
MAAQGFLTTLDKLEAPFCMALNRFCRKKAVFRSFALISRLGNGVFWYTLMLLLPILYGQHGGVTVLQMLFAGACGLIFYRRIKASTSRPRPYIALDEIEWNVPPLDAFSFPSGHTLHAVAFQVLLFYQHPALAIMVLPFTILVALSRVVLGMHYPSDILVGSFIGAALAVLSNYIIVF